MKRYLAMLMCVVMLFTMLPTWAFAAGDDEAYELTDGYPEEIGE